MESISKIKLKNQAGAITMLKGYVKVASDSEAYYKCGATDNFDVGQSGMIDLNDHIGDAEKKQSRKDGYIFPGDLVTAYAAISALHRLIEAAVLEENDYAIKGFSDRKSVV